MRRIGLEISLANRWRDDPLLCLAIAWLSLEPRRYRVLLGEHQEIIAALAGQSVYTCNFVSIALVLHNLRANAADAGITLPKRLTVDPADVSAYEKWRANIQAYQDAAGVRVARKRLVKA